MSLVLSSSNSPKTPTHVDKLPMSFCLQNRFAILTTKDDCLDSSAMSINTIVDREQHILLAKVNNNDRAPPIYIKSLSIKNCYALKNTFIQFMSINGFSCNSTSS